MEKCGGKSIYQRQPGARRAAHTDRECGLHVLTIAELHLHKRGDRSHKCLRSDVSGRLGIAYSKFINEPLNLMQQARYFGIPGGPESSEDPPERFGARPRNP